jgi:HK97 family phage major capsid protein/HK97 family phage prohead protease
MDRAYSLLEVKAVDDAARVIRGVATSPTTDRVGDIVEPLGVRFKNPMPLLHQHRHDEPVGTVSFDKPTKDGITFEARLASIETPGALKDRVDLAWDEVKAGLVRGVSIGFRALEYSRLDTGGLRFLETEVYELSLVTIPANTDATILTIRSIDSALRAASGQSKSVFKASPGELVDVKTDRVLPAGVTASKSSISITGRSTMAKKTLAEQVSALEASRAAKAARMEEIQDKAGDEDRTKDDAEREEFDTLGDEIETLDKELGDLRRLEKAQISTAKAVMGHNSQTGTESRGGGQVVTSMRSNLPPGIEFARYAMCLMTARGNPDTALKIAEARYPDMARIHGTLKAAVAAGSTTDPLWAAPLVDYQQFAGDFIEFLRPMTIVGKFGTNGIPSLRRVPFNIQVPAQISGGDAYWVGEGRPKPLTNFSFDRITLRWAKVANIAVITEELARFSSPSAEMLVRDALAEAIVSRIDVTFVNPAITAIADTRPASITNGVTPINSSGNDAAAIRADIRALYAPFIAANLAPTSGVWIMDSTVALALSLMQNALGQAEFPGVTMMGGTFMGLPVIVSEHVAGLGSPPSQGMVILVNASDIYLADEGQVVVDASREASLQMDNAPTMASTSGSPIQPTATSVVSMFQTNSIAIRAERFINWQRRRDEAVSWLEGVEWGE